ncbi:hypothetical protein GX865_00295 [Candidatus Saccharibacteria bacterium]|jgi:hypothetical protein|nr:hypothetical protein [Candidatus Saccharibacteria bacterium]
MDNELILNEIISVVSVFSPGHQACRPVKFKRSNNQEVLISEVGLGYPVSRGSRVVHIFDVTDGQSEYRLEFNSRTLAWRLVREASYEG